MNPRLPGIFASIGAPFVRGGVVAGEMFAVAARALVAMGRGRIRHGEVAHQCYLIGNRSLAFITLTLGLLGLISVYQVAMQLQQLLPDFSMLGAGFAQILVREFGPTICGLMVATRVGSGIAAEIGSMVVTDQVDALRMCNADPIEYLIVPRVVACATMLICLAIYGVLVAFVCGMAVADFTFDVNVRTFASLTLVTGADVVVGLVKAALYGVAIPIIAGHAGLHATGGSEGVGWATTRAVVNTSFAVIILDFTVSAVSYVVVGQ